MDPSPGTAALLVQAQAAPDTLGLADWAALLAADGPTDRTALHAAAYAVKRREVGPVIRARGLVEFSNHCVQNCRYCGIRRDNRGAVRYQLDAAEIVAAARGVHAAGYGSLVLQAGERRDPAFIEFVAEALVAIHAATGGSLGVTLSLGEQSPAAYRRWREAGAHRYLLRIETSDRGLFRALHPADQDWDGRAACLDLLRDAGYQVGTGVLIGLPGQTAAHLAADLLFLRDRDVDMIGMGPFIPHDGTPLADAPCAPARQLDLGLAMIACARLLLPDANIAATTALEALEPAGRRLGLLAGANVVMPNHTPADRRGAYDLYRGKPTAADTRAALVALADTIGETVGWHEAGDAPRWRRRAGRN
ncbi:MAG: [FeFe] hydrogenase H-cluster radical SAM maturase HydE [Krumholzibacteria bacterium]|nr:[FeFe] hydrogenase H-cluster radical SAM maturase HydE [Candidatus Krumholzibacteria bacterium]